MKDVNKNAMFDYDGSQEAFCLDCCKKNTYEMVNKSNINFILCVICNNSSQPSGYEVSCSWLGSNLSRRLNKNRYKVKNYTAQRSRNTPMQLLEILFRAHDKWSAELLERQFSISSSSVAYAAGSVFFASVLAVPATEAVCKHIFKARGQVLTSASVSMLGNRVESVRVIDLNSRRADATTTRSKRPAAAGELLRRHQTVN